MKRKFGIFILLLSIFYINASLSAQEPEGYYKAIEGKQKVELKTALYRVISSGYVSVKYDNLDDVYRTSDITASGNIWDVYSTCTWTFGNKKCGNYKNVCDCYNKEHSIPQSWFGGKSPMYSDAFHLYPTDGKVNGQRSNYPFGECGIGTSLGANALGRLGSSTFPGYTGTVFEPDDEYKGDFARTYFYFATRYENIMTSINGATFNKTTYPAFSTWSMNMFLKWHREDPVSQKEIDRNNAIYKWQKNRNPFIDHPELAEYIWGDKTDKVYYLDGDDPDPDDKVTMVDAMLKSSLDPFIPYSVVGDYGWTADAVYGAKMSGYGNNLNSENEDWLISPNLDFTDISSAKLSFDHAINFAEVATLNTNHTLWFSADYVSGSPATATWIQVEIPTYPAGNSWTFISSGEMDVPAEFMGKTNIHFAFKYMSSNTTASTWEITKVKLIGTKGASGIGEEDIQNGIQIYYVDGNVNIYIEGRSESINIYDVFGRQIVNKNSMVGTSSIPVEKGQIYIVKVGTKVSKILAK